MEIKGEFRYYKDKSLTLDLEPEDFVNCDTIQGLQWEINRKFYNTHDIEFNHIIRQDIKIPEEFMSKWKEIVNFIPNNIMTYKLRDRMIERAEEIKIYSGAHLNYRRHRHDGGLQLERYCDFHFDDKKNYKCWIAYSDHWEYTDEWLAYCEETSERALI